MMIATLAVAAALQDPFPEPGKISTALSPEYNVQNVLDGEPYFIDFKQPNEKVEKNLLERLRLAATFKLDEIEGGMILCLERRYPFREQLSMLWTLETLTELVFVAPNERPWHFKIDRDGAIHLNSYVMQSSGPPPAPVTHFRRYRKMHLKRRTLKLGADGVLRTDPPRQLLHPDIFKSL
jgi:hypothetical protein